MDEQKVTTGWLIERNIYGKTYWLQLDEGVAVHHYSWTDDSNNALRFAREYDARRFAYIYVDWSKKVDVTEHQWP